MENYLSQFIPNWGFPEYTQGREFYYTAPKKTPAWTYQDKLYYVHHSGAKAELMESGLVGEHPRVLAELPAECPTDSIYVTENGIFLVSSEFAFDEAGCFLRVAYYGFDGYQYFCGKIAIDANESVVNDFNISGVVLYFCTNDKVFSYDFSPYALDGKRAKRILTENSDNFLGFDRMLTDSSHRVYLRARLKADVPCGEKSYWVVGAASSICNGYDFCFNIPELTTSRSTFTLYDLAEYEPSSYLNITFLDLQHGLAWITDGQKRAIGVGTDYFSFPVQLSYHYPKFTLHRLDNITPIKEVDYIAQSSSMVVNGNFALHYFDGLQRFFTNAAREAYFEPVIPTNSRNMLQFTSFNSPAHKGRDAQFSFFMVVNGILYATPTTYDEDIHDYVSAPELLMYSVRDLKPNRSKSLTPLNTSIQLGVPQKPADETETAPGSWQDDDEPKIDFMWSSGPARYIDSDTEPDVELSDYDDPEEDIFSGLDLDALDEEPAPSAPARKAVARRVTPRSTAPRSTVTRQPSAPGDAKVLTSTDVKYGILTFGKKLADVPVGTPCTLYYNGNTYSCKAHKTTRGRIDGLRRLYIDNPELQEGARVTATYDDDEGEITLTLL